VRVNYLNIARFRLPPRCRLGLRSSEMLRDMYWQLVPDTQGQNSPFFSDCLTLGDVTEVSSRNAGNLRCVTAKKSEDLPECHYPYRQVARVTPVTCVGHVLVTHVS
jgi:hypothetical protein